MVNSSAVEWSDVWLWPIRLAGGRFMTETAISLPMCLTHACPFQSYSASPPSTRLFDPPQLCFIHLSAHSAPASPLFPHFSSSLSFSFVFYTATLRHLPAGGICLTERRGNNKSSVSPNRNLTHTHTHRRAKISKGSSELCVSLSECATAFYV